MHHRPHHPPIHLSLGLLLLIALLASCTPITPAAPIPTSTPTTTLVPPTPTPTIVWFPPTPTFTPFPTRQITPTPDMLPGLGDLILNDTFDSPDNWPLTTTAEGAVSLGKNELSIAIAMDKAYLYSVRQGPNLTDFYAEITASPALCQGADEFGLLLRYTSTYDYYRFSLTCDGQVRLDRLAAGDASSPQPWIYSGAYPPGAPNIIRLGVWAVGSEMRFFVNDQYQFTAQDPVHTGGSLGVFARSTGGHALTVSFSNLVVRAVK